MRPALLRLLKRPSAIRILDDLIISDPDSLDIGKLGYGNLCLRCQRRHTQQKAVIHLAQSRLGPENELPSRTTETRQDPSLKLHGHDVVPRGEETPTIMVKIEPHLLLPTDDCIISWTLDPEKLEYESNVGHLNDIGSRLVDDPHRRHDFTLWEELLRYRQRHHGEKGTLDIWEGLTHRVDDVDLPTTAERANFFWQSFIDAGLQREWLLNDVTDYAAQLWQRTGRRWPKFHEAVVGGFLNRGLPSQAVQWHYKLQDPHLSHPNDISRVLEAALSCTPRPTDCLLATEKPLRASRAGLEAFKAMCRSNDDHKIYKVVISTLMERGRPMDALFMHDFLIKRRDTPPSFEDVKPLLEYTESYIPWNNKKMTDNVRKVGSDLRMFCKENFKTFTPQLGDCSDLTPRVEGRETEGKEKDVWPKEKPFKDEFGARLFATNALTFDMILSGLRMFGVPAIGPLSLREMALRAQGSSDIVNKIEALRQAGISIGDSLFSRLVRKWALESREILLQDLLHSDQHPEVLEDASLQESLLVSYYTTRDWRQYSMTLAILGEVSGEDHGLHNINFRKHIAIEDWDAASKVVERMSRLGKPLSRDSITFMVERILTPRTKGSPPLPRRRSHPVNEEAFLIRTLQQVASHGGAVPPDLWVEALKRLGMTNRWEELHNLCLWLACHYSVNKGSTMGSKPALPALTIGNSTRPGTPLAQYRGVLRRVFDPQMQMAIVAWGFKLRPVMEGGSKIYNPFGTGGGNLVPWVRGLVLLRQLRERGVWIWDSLVRRACRQRLRVLFGLPRYSARPWNRRLRQENPYDVNQVVGDLLTVWGPSLFDGQEKHDLEGLVNLPSTGMSCRRTRVSMTWASRFSNTAARFPV